PSAYQERPDKSARDALAPSSIVLRNLARKASSTRSHARFVGRPFGARLEMKGNGQAVAHGAASILNAFATGKGAAIGVDLWTRARVSLKDGEGETSGFVSSNPQESSKLAIRVVEKVLEHYGYERKLHGEVVTSSNIPTPVGLKRSSAAANAVALATASALDREPNDD